MSKYALGLDFGSLSARALLVEIGTGRELATATLEYAHAVMDTALPDGTRLGVDWALQHPQDYLDCLKTVIPQVIRESGVSASDIVGLGVDFTACTLLPAKADGTPLCFLPEFASNPHAYVKLWKHHAAQPYADRFNEIAISRGETFLKRCGGKVSSEWLFPKAWQTLAEAPEVFDAADRFIEAGDWVIWQLTGKETHNACLAGYKAEWSKDAGYPSEEFLACLDERLRYFVKEKMPAPVQSMGELAGLITPEAAQWTGLCPGTAVAVCGIDAHVSMPAAGIARAGEMLMIMGTSTCHLLLGKEEKDVPGICGYVEDGMLPGFFGYEAGQCCVGDHFAWLCDNCVPARYFEEAKERGIHIQKLLTEKAEALRPGESGLLALDWWNGNRSILCDGGLTGIMLGMTLQTKAEEMYRALVEATAYGTRMILDNFVSHGIEVDALRACGGIAEKNPMMMQIYADVTGREIRLARSAQTPALGSALFGAVAAGSAKGGYDTIQQAAAEMGGTKEVVYRPIAENQKVYEALYQEYARLHDLFGRGGDDVLRRLKALKKETVEE